MSTVKQTRITRCVIVLAGVLVAGLALPAVSKEPVLILPHPSLLKAQFLLRQAEQAGAAAAQPGVVLALQETINAAWSAYHLQVEEKADEPDDDEAILARHLAERAEVDAELLQVALRTLEAEAQLDAMQGRRAGLQPERMVIPAPLPPAELERH